jgi:hypothetical protein
MFTTATAVRLSATPEAEAKGDPSEAAERGSLEERFTCGTMITSARFVLFSAPAEALRPEVVTTFATEAEARDAFAKWRNSPSSVGQWAEVARVGGGDRPRVVVWSGRAFPPVSETDLDLLGEQR